MCALNGNFEEGVYLGYGLCNAELNGGTISASCTPTCEVTVIRQ